MTKMLELVSWTVIGILDLGRIHGLGGEKAWAYWDRGGEGMGILGLEGEKSWAYWARRGKNHGHTGLGRGEFMGILGWEGEVMGILGWGGGGAKKSWVYWVGYGKAWASGMVGRCLGHIELGEKSWAYWAGRGKEGQSVESCHTLS